MATKNQLMVLEAEGTYIDFKALFEMFPFLVKRILAGVGYRAARRLYAEHLSGQDLTYRPARHSGSGAPISVRGRRMVLYAVDKNAKYVAIRSFPVNLFERGRGLRSGEREPGKYIFKKFGASFNAGAVAKEILDEMTMGGDSDMMEQAEKVIRGSFGEGRSPFGDTENKWRGRWAG